MIGAERQAEQHRERDAEERHDDEAREERPVAEPA